MLGTSWKAFQVTFTLVQKKKTTFCYGLYQEHNNLQILCLRRRYGNTEENRRQNMFSIPVRYWKANEHLSGSIYSTLHLKLERYHKQTIHNTVSILRTFILTLFFCHPPKKISCYVQLFRHILTSLKLSKTTVSLFASYLLGINLEQKRMWWRLYSLLVPVFLWWLISDDTTLGFCPTVVGHLPNAL